MKTYIYLLLIGSVLSLPLDSDDALSLVAQPRSIGGSQKQKDIEMEVVIIEGVPEQNRVRVQKADEPQLPPEVKITSDVVYVKGEHKKGKVIEIGADGIPIIHGVRQPDDETDIWTWRNAKVINGELVTKPDAAAYTTDVSFDHDNSYSNQDYSSSGVEYSNPGTAYLTQDYSNYDQEYYTNTNRFEKTGRILSGWTPNQPELQQNVASIQEEPQLFQNDYPDFYYRGYYSDDRSDTVTQPDQQQQYSTQDSVITSPNYQQQQQQQQYYTTQNENGEEVYYPYDPNQNDVHNDRSPYAYEPHTSTQFSQISSTQYNPVPSTTVNQVPYYAQAPTGPIYTDGSSTTGPRPVKPSLVPVDDENFVIREYTYQQGPGGPVFKIPVPIPKDQINELESQSSESQYDYADPYAGVDEGPLDFVKNVGLAIQNAAGDISNTVSEAASPVVRRVQQMAAPYTDKLHEVAIKPITEGLGIQNQVDTITEKFGNSEDIVPLVIGGTALTGLMVLGIFAASSAFNNNGNFSISLGRKRRDIGDSLDEHMDNFITELDNTQTAIINKFGNVVSHEWKETPCSKRLFCDVLVKVAPFSTETIKRRIDSFLSLLDNKDDERIKSLAKELMESVERKDCSKYVCGHNVDSSQIESKSSVGPR